MYYLHGTLNCQHCNHGCLPLPPKCEVTTILHALSAWDSASSIEKITSLSKPILQLCILPLDNNLMSSISRNNVHIILQNFTIPPSFYHHTPAPPCIRHETHHSPIPCMLYIATPHQLQVNYNLQVQIQYFKQIMKPQIP